MNPSLLARARHFAFIAARRVRLPCWLVPCLLPGSGLAGAEQMVKVGDYDFPPPAPRK